MRESSRREDTVALTLRLSDLGEESSLRGSSLVLTLARPAEVRLVSRYSPMSESIITSEKPGFTIMSPVLSRFMPRAISDPSISLWVMTLLSE